MVLGCLSLDSYIKPQLGEPHDHELYVVYLLIPTSNHNFIIYNPMWISLFISWFLHQTTTNISDLKTFSLLFISWFLHQTTTPCWERRFLQSCLSLDSYIKPQQLSHETDWLKVVYLLIPTSNHNVFPFWKNLVVVVYLLIPTSNHNKLSFMLSNETVVYLLIPTSNHNQPTVWKTASRVVYLLIPTSNHNRIVPWQSHFSLFISWFLHQTTTSIR